MKNKVSILVILGVSMLTGCATKKTIGEQNSNIQKPEPPNHTARKLAQLPSGTEFNSNSSDVGLKKVGDKWQFTVKDNEQTFAFDVNKMKKGEVFDETEYKKMKHKLENQDGTSQIVEMDTKIKIAKSDLTYLHYGFLEFKVPFGKDTKGNDKFVKAFDPFFVVDKNKQERFEVPERDINFSGTTSAILTKREAGSEFSHYEDIKGTANMTIAAGQSKGNFTFEYNNPNWNKKITIKNMDLINPEVHDLHYGWEINDENFGIMTNKFKPVWKHKILDNNEIVGSYKINMQQGTTGYTLDGVFGMKKQ